MLAEPGAPEALATLTRAAFWLNEVVALNPLVWPTPVTLYVPFVL